MLAYRHAFHAGNVGDVLKHWLLVEVLARLNAKEKPWTYFETHAGAGVYSFSRPIGGRLPTEWQQGIGRLWANRQEAPAALTRYLDQVAAFNPDGALTLYPGSPALARALARSQPSDRLILVERHPTDLELLQRLFANDPQVCVVPGDGWSVVLPMMPPAVRRGLVLIDPSYELSRDYHAVIPFVRTVRRRFPQAVVFVWYPLVKRYEVPLLRRRLRNVLPEDHLWVELPVAAPPRDGWGMYGSGIVVVQPPYGLGETVQQGLPWLARRLAQPGAAEPQWEEQTK